MAEPEKPEPGLRHGIAAHLGVMFGFDGDDRAIFERTLGFLERTCVGSGQRPIWADYVAGTRATDGGAPAAREC